MSPSSSNKKLHYFDMSDILKWPSKERNQRLTRHASLSDQPQFMNRINDSKSTKVDEKQTSPRSWLQTKDKLKKAEEPKPSTNRECKASTCKVGENLIYKNMICENDNPKFWITLTREEIEEDYQAITGKKLPRNMLKRDKTMQKDLDAIFPALTLEGRNAENLPKKYCTKNVCSGFFAPNL